MYPMWCRWCRAALGLGYADATCYACGPRDSQRTLLVPALLLAIEGDTGASQFRGTTTIWPTEHQPRSRKCHEHVFCICQHASKELWRKHRYPSPIVRVAHQDTSL